MNCPGNNWGPGTFRANPVPETELTNRLRIAMRDWLMKGTPPPPSRWPTLVGGNLVPATKQAMGFPSGVPGIPDSIFLPENFVNMTLDYDWGPQFNPIDLTGVPTNQPPPIKNVIPLKVPRVDADGNELGGVPTVLRDAPLGTYLGWNITASGFHAGQVCNYVGGMIPFAVTMAERLANGDPRLSLQERYGTHAGYVAAVTAAQTMRSHRDICCLPMPRRLSVKQRRATFLTRRHNNGKRRSRTPGPHLLNSFRSCRRPLRRLSANLTLRASSTNRRVIRNANTNWARFMRAITGPKQSKDARAFP